MPRRQTKPGNPFRPEPGDLNASAEDVSETGAIGTEQTWELKRRRDVKNRLEHVQWAY